MPEFDRDRLAFGRHRVHGITGCHSVTARYEAAGSALRFTDVATTLTGCPDRAGPRLSLIDAMQRTRSHRREGRRLFLLGARGRALARLAKD